MKGSFSLEPLVAPLPAGLAFLRQARFRLREDYFVKINAALAELSELPELNNEQIWWRPNEASNSIGNLILHLAGNMRQWMIAGVGGAVDIRQRAAEFAERDGISTPELMALLAETLQEVDAVLAGLERELTAMQSDAPLQRECVPQGYAQTVLDAVFHVVEHFSYHTGQIILLAKCQAAGRIRLYDDQRLNLERD
ncbi:MAG: DinB family protein [Blastocatellia bacterium]